MRRYGRKRNDKRACPLRGKLFGELFEVAAHGFFFVDVFDNVTLVRVMRGWATTILYEITGAL